MIAIPLVDKITKQFRQSSTPHRVLRKSLLPAWTLATGFDRENGCLAIPRRRRVPYARQRVGVSHPLCLAAGLDGPGTPRAQARRDSGSLGPDRRAARAQSIELGGNRARLRSTIQAGGGPIELTRRCRGTPLAALVPGQGGRSKRICVGPLARHRALNRHLHDAFTRRARPACALTSSPGAVPTGQNEPFYVC